MSPEKPCRSRLRSTELPSAPGFSDAPTIATARALSSRSSLWMRGRSIASTVICSGLLLRPIVSTESGLVGLLVEELADAFLAPVIVVAVGGFLRADQLILGIVIAHHRDAAYRVLGRLQCDRVLLEQDGRDLGHAALEIGERQRFVDQAPFGGGPAVDILAHHRMVHRLAERQQLDRDLGRPAARQNAPVDLAEAELRFLGGEGAVAGDQRAITAPEAPAIDHRDGRLLVPAQAAPPAIALALRLARRAQPLGLGLAEIFLEIHARRPRRAFAGQHQHADIVAEFERVEHVHHFAIERRRHAVALVGAVELHPGDAVDDVIRDSAVGAGLGHLFSLSSPLPGREGLGWVGLGRWWLWRTPTAAPSLPGGARWLDGIVARQGLDGDPAQLGVAVDAGLAAEAAVTGALGAAERHLRLVMHGRPVDVAAARLDLARDTQAARGVAGEHRG